MAELVRGTRPIREREQNARLIADAPLLLAEVRRLREELADLQRQKYGTPCKCESWITVARDAEEKLEVVRQSHARLLAAIGRLLAQQDKLAFKSWQVALRRLQRVLDAERAVAEAEAL